MYRKQAATKWLYMWSRFHYCCCTLNFTPRLPVYCKATLAVGVLGQNCSPTYSLDGMKISSKHLTLLDVPNHALIMHRLNVWYEHVSYHILFSLRNLWHSSQNESYLQVIPVFKHLMNGILLIIKFATFWYIGYIVGVTQIRLSVSYQL